MTTTSSTPVPRSRRLLFGLLAAGFALVLLELGSWLLLSLTAGHPVGHGASRARLAALREVAPELAGTEDEEVEEPEEAAPDGYFERFVQNSNIVHPFLGYVRDPASSRDRTLDPQSVAFGFLSNKGPIFHEAVPGQVRVAVVGGSVARNLAADGGGEVLAAALEASPRFAGRKMVVVSLAAGGYKEPQQLMTLNYFLSLGATFDLVINIDGFNEIALPPIRNVTQDVFPFYPHSWHLRVGELGLAERQRIGELAYLRQRRLETAELFSRLPWRASFTAALVWTVLDRAWADRVARAEAALVEEGGERVDETGDETGKETESERDHQRLGPQRVYPDRPAMFADLAAYWRRSSILIDALCRGLEIEYHHFLQPNQYVPDSKPLSEVEQNLAYIRESPYREAVEVGYPLLRENGERLRRRGVRFHDLTGIYAGHQETLYVDHCCHVNRAGNEIMAEAIARAIGGEGRPGHEPGAAATSQP